MSLKRFIKDKMDLANWFIEAIHQRRVTMVNVMRLIIKFQPACNMAENKIKKKIFDSLILIINFL